jgi:alkylation response protein AidB-like acyl-CoA dehydrogenase
VVLSVHIGLCCLVLLQWGTEEQKQRFLVPLAKGEKVGLGAFTEPGRVLISRNIQATAAVKAIIMCLMGKRCGFRWQQKLIMAS